MSSEAPRTFPVFVYGPPGWGKTTHARIFARYFGKTNIVDDWQWNDPVPGPDTLVLTNHLPPPLAHGVPIADALRLIPGCKEARRG